MKCGECGGKFSGPNGVQVMCPSCRVLKDAKVCYGCSKSLPLNAFSSNANASDGRQSLCRLCCSAALAARPDRHVSSKRRYVRRKYGLTLEEYNELLSLPCAICGNASEHLDHCHYSGTNREALCHNCNTGIGLLQHSVELLGAAIVYLSQHEAAA